MTEPFQGSQTPSPKELSGQKWSLGLAALSGLLISCLVLVADVFVGGGTELSNSLNGGPAEIAFLVARMIWPSIFLVLIAMIRNREEKGRLPSA